MKKKYIKPEMTSLTVHDTPLMAASPEINSTPPGDKNTGMLTKRKIYPTSTSAWEKWEEE